MVTNIISNPFPSSHIVQIFIKSLSGKTLTLAISPAETTDSLMFLISQKESIPRYQQRLVFLGKILEINRSLLDYNIQQGSTLHLTLGLNGGSYRYCEDCGHLFIDRPEWAKCKDCYKRSVTTPCRYPCCNRKANESGFCSIHSKLSEQQKRKLTKAYNTSQSKRNQRPPTFPPRPSVPTPFDILGVPKSASFEEIRRSYRAKALVLHPDKNQQADQIEATRKFQELNNAYATLQQLLKKD